MYRSLLLAFIFSISLCLPVSAQTQRPLTSQEVVKLLYQVSRSPETRDEVVDEIRKRGIGFQLTDGMRSLVATKTGNDAIIRRTLEEAERRRVNPASSTLPTETEGIEILERTRNVTLAAANAMPDFLVKQFIKRSYAYGNTENWRVSDNLTVAVGYRANLGEEYKLLTIDGRPAPEDVQAGSDYGKYAKGTSTSGVEYISAVADIFKPETKTEFRMVDTDVIRNRRTVVYEFTVKKEFSSYRLSVSDLNVQAIVGSRGRMWIDRELDRVVRFEQISTEIPPNFPITAAKSLIDYDWVTINERKYLLPIHSEILITSLNPKFVLQSRNDVRFRNYQKFSAELKVVDEVDGDDEPLEPEPPKPAKPIKPPR